jgi:hypothetical protein
MIKTSLNTESRGHIAVGLAAGEQVIRWLEPVASIAVTAYVAPLGIVVEPAAHREVLGTNRSANACTHIINVRVRTVFCSSSRYANCLCTALMQHTASHELKP